MSDYHDTFFDEERPWSRIKNRILGSYMTPYMAKIAKRGKRIVLIDAFAGAGTLSNGDAGSPLLICHAAEKYAKGKYSAYFFNIKEKYHNHLYSILNKAGYSSANPMLGDGIELLQKIIDNLTDESLFIYIDPFGLDCEFDVLQPLLNRNKRYSTEILINIHFPIIHRLAGRNAIQSGEYDEDQMAKHHDKLTRTLGGDYWKDILLTGSDQNTKEKEQQLIQEYMKHLSSTNYLNYTGACPVRERMDSQTKYFMVFASTHPDSMLLFNDNMCKSFNEYMNDQVMKDTMFANLDWSEWRDPKVLEEIVINYVGRYPSSSRKTLWRHIVQDYFMLFTEREYRQAVKSTYLRGEIDCVTPVKRGGIRPTKQLNDNCEFSLPSQQRLL